MILPFNVQKIMQIIKIYWNIVAFSLTNVATVMNTSRHGITIEGESLHPNCVHNLVFNAQIIVLHVLTFRFRSFLMAITNWPWLGVDKYFEPNGAIRKIIPSREVVRMCLCQTQNECRHESSAIISYHPLACVFLSRRISPDIPQLISQRSSSVNNLILSLG